ncbi:MULTISPECIES: DUF2827 domain-containing protein [Paraburkholderia]|uniref:DUF2827 domain-containing protein n=1 Tax=Paraburkholderia TaxID=1822464 RepID=UPI003218D505
MRIGISVLTHTGQSVWENGLGQNIFFFAQLLRALPFVTDVVLLDCGDQRELPPEAVNLAQEFRLVPPREATDLVDVVFEMGGGLDVEWLDHIRALGKKVVFFCCGQPYAGLVEPSVFKKSGYFSRAQRCDEIWILAKDLAFKPMLQTLHRCPVFEVPFLWNPVFIERRVALVAQAGFHFGYEPAPKRDTPRALRVAIFEPNISVVKCCVIPMLVCDEAFRKDPATIARMHVLNSIQMKDHPSFAFLTRSLDLHKHEKIHLDQRHDFVGYMSQHANAVVAHQWHNAQNIAYLDALYGGYPLVHNSPWLAELGYYYADSDIAAGGAQLVKAARDHDADHDAYMRRARAFLARLNPLDADNRAQYARRLLDLGTRQTAKGASC